jgi:hypothetical protein
MYAVVICSKIFECIGKDLLYSNNYRDEYCDFPEHRLNSPAE